MKTRILFLLSFFIFISSNILSQNDTISDTVKAWDVGSTLSINFSQNSFSKNWQGGGNNAISGLGLFNIHAKYNKDKTSWENVLDVKYGLSKQEGLSTRKTDDNLELLSKFGYKASKKWFYSVSLTFKTQLAEGREYFEDSSSVISNFMAPGYIVLSLGMDYKPNKNFSMLVSPLSGKLTFVLDEELSDQGRYGVKAGKQLKSEYGAALKLLYNKEIIKNITLSTNYNCFFNYTGDSQLDLDLETKINMKVNDLISTNFIVQLIYDKDQIDEIQFKEILGVGITITL